MQSALWQSGGLPAGVWSATARGPSSTPGPDGAEAVWRRHVTATGVLCSECCAVLGVLCSGVLCS
jgi:hypothetical protein